MAGSSWADALPSVLVVDDYADAATSLVHLLMWHGYPARAAADGRAALRAARESPPDAVLLEVDLPGEDGCALAEQLCDLLGRRPLLVALTCSGQVRDRLRCLWAGFDAYLVKPADPRELLRLLAKVRPRAVAHPLLR